MNKLERNFSQKIIAWYLLNKRDLPWRSTVDPYRVWLSEIILQQTRVAQGLPYYLKFVAAFPTIKALAMAEEQAVLKLWQGLGYYTRARNMHAAARFVFNELGGNFPNNYKDLLLLKGIGDYTASAIASFCFNEVQPVVDGNVYRVLSRCFGVDTPINTNQAKKEFKALAFELIDLKKPGLYNQATMELGSLQCKPKQPNCKTCPLNTICIARQKNQIAILPKKKPKIKVRKRYFNYLVVETREQQTLVSKRYKKGIWKNLYEFPLVETDENLDYLALLENPKFNDFVLDKDFNLKLLTPKTIIHKLSHQHLYIKFWLLEVESINKPTLLWKEVLKLPFPIVIFSFIEEFLQKKE